MSDLYDPDRIEAVAVDAGYDLVRSTYDMVESELAMLVEQRRRINERIKVLRWHEKQWARMVKIADEDRPYLPDEAEETQEEPPHPQPLMHVLAGLEEDDDDDLVAPWPNL